MSNDVGQQEPLARAAEAIVQADALTTDAGARAMDELLAGSGPRPTAIIAANDLVALGAMRSLRSHGIRCPEDISVIGYNDMPFAADFAPALTTCLLYTSPSPRDS